MLVKRLTYLSFPRIKEKNTYIKIPIFKHMSKNIDSHFISLLILTSGSKLVLFKRQGSVKSTMGITPIANQSKWTYSIVVPYMEKGFSFLLRIFFIFPLRPFWQLRYLCLVNFIYFVNKYIKVIDRNYSFLPMHRGLFSGVYKRCLKRHSCQLMRPILFNTFLLIFFFMKANTWLFYEVAYMYIDF